MAAEPMRVGVLTFHACINFGSYWQARCLAEGLAAMGHEAVLLDHDCPQVRRAEWRCAFQPLLPVRSPRADLPLYAAKARAFLEAFERLPLSPRFPLHEPERAGRFDAVVIGSDEVWNFRHPWYGYKPVFFGEGLRAERLVSYAASFGNHDAADGVGPDWAGRLARFDALSVRDANSRTLVRRAIGRDPATVLDPCLAFPPPSDATVPDAPPYLALYGHGLPDWFAAAVRRFAARRGLRIVSLGYRNDWADEQRIAIGPETFSALIAGAQAVATNFFHGCVFALLHGRPFVTAPSAYRANKVTDLAATLAAERHVVDAATPEGEYAALLGAPLEDGVAGRIAAMRAASRAWLADALG